MRYVKTEAGQLAFKERSPQISARQRSMFILIDGKKTDQEVLAATAGLGITAGDIAHLVEAGFIAPVDGAVAASAPAAGPSSGAQAAAPAAVVGGLTPSELYSRAYPIATRLTASLGLRGFRLNVAVEHASGYEDLVALLPKIAEAVGRDKANELEAALRG